MALSKKHTEPTWQEYLNGLRISSNGSSSRAHKHVLHAAAPKHEVVAQAAQKKTTPKHTGKSSAKQAKKTTAKQTPPPPPPPPKNPRDKDNKGRPWRGILALILCAIPLWAIPFFFEDVVRYVLLGVLTLFTVGLLAYWLGRSRSVALAPFYAGERLEKTGDKVLGNPPLAVGMIVIAITSLAVLLPSNLGQSPDGENKDAGPGKVITSEVKNEVFAMGQYHTLDSTEYFAVRNINPAAIRTLNNGTRQAPKGYRWVLYQVRMNALAKEGELFASNFSIRLVDDHNQIYLPDAGSGANNTDSGFERVGGNETFWNPAYLVPVDRKPLRVEITPTTASKVILVFRDPTQKELDFVNARIKRGMGLDAAQGRGSGLRDLVTLTEKERRTAPQASVEDDDSATTTPSAE